MSTCPRSIILFYCRIFHYLISKKYPTLLLLIYLCRLVKIVNAETQLASKKALDEDQKQLIQTKPSVEKALVELESIKAVLEDVAKEVSDRYLIFLFITSVLAHILIAFVIFIPSLIHSLTHWCHVVSL